jgi:hypothetical protein
LIDQVTNIFENDKPLIALTPEDDTNLPLANDFEDAVCATTPHCVLSDFYSTEDDPIEYVRLCGILLQKLTSM